MRKITLARALAGLLCAALLLTACRPVSGGDGISAGTGLNVVATTSIVGEVLTRVGGDLVQVRTLIPLGTDPHAFEPRPQDAAALADADLIFAAGAGLEEFLHPLLEATGAEERLVELSAGIALLPFEGEQNAGEEEGHAGGDPHTWLDPANLIVWTENARAALTQVDPAHAQEYRANAEAYSAELRALDAWARAQVAGLPVENRKLVSDHAELGYFAHAYGFEQSGTIVASFSTSAAPSARELAVLEDLIRAQGVPAVFISSDVSPVLAEQIARDTGVKLVTLYTHSLSAADGPAATYLDLMRYNVNAIVSALRP